LKNNEESMKSFQKDINFVYKKIIK
jgi:hypothetical protein